MMSLSTGWSYGSGCTLLALTLIALGAAKGFPEDQLESSELALARVSGRTLHVFPPGAPEQSAELDFYYLRAQMSQNGNSLVGWGFPGGSAAQPGHGSAVIVISEAYGRRNRTIEGFLNPTEFSLSPDGRRLAIIGTNLATNFDGLQVIDVAVSNPAEHAIKIQAADRTLDDSVGWSPDSKCVMFAVGTKILNVNLESMAVRLMARGTLPSWSPDGSKMAFVGTKSKFQILDLSSHETIPLAADIHVKSRASWAPDSQKFIVALDWGKRNSQRNCYVNRRLVEYTLPNLLSVPLLDPCSLKPELFFWIRDWKRWVHP